MHPHLRRAHDAVWDRLYDPRTQMVYDFAFTDDAQFPTEDDVRAQRPNCSGWATGMEDSCLTAGFVIDAFLTAHRITGRTEWAEKARALFQGLVTLGTVCETSGFVARAVAPTHRAVYPNSSTDQFTSFVYGLWRFAQSPIATAAEQDTAAALVADVAALVERCGDTVPRADLRPSIYGDTDDFSAGRANRLLLFYRLAHALTGEDHWQRLYRDRVEADGRLRLACFYGPEPVPEGANLHAISQTQVALRALYELETDPAVKALYRLGLRAGGRAVLCRLKTVPQAAASMEPVRRAPDTWRYLFDAFLAEQGDYDPENMADVRAGLRYFRDHAADVPDAALQATEPYYYDFALRHFTEALAVAMLSDAPEVQRDAAELAAPMLLSFDWSRLGDSRLWECLDLGYWRGVEAGLLPRGETT